MNFNRPIDYMEIYFKKRLKDNRAEVIVSINQYENLIFKDGFQLLGLFICTKNETAVFSICNLDQLALVALALLEIFSLIKLATKRFFFF